VIPLFYPDCKQIARLLITVVAIINKRIERLDATVGLLLIRRRGKVNIVARAI